MHRSPNKSRIPSQHAADIQAGAIIKHYFAGIYWCEFIGTAGRAYMHDHAGTRDAFAGISVGTPSTCKLSCSERATCTGFEYSAAHRKCKFQSGGSIGVSASRSTWNSKINSLDFYVNSRSGVCQAPTSKEAKLKYLSFIYMQNITSITIFEDLDIAYRSTGILPPELVPCDRVFPGRENSIARQWWQGRCSGGKATDVPSDQIYVVPRRPMSQLQRSPFADNAWVEVQRMARAEGILHGQPYGCWFFPAKGAGKFVNIGRTLVFNSKWEALSNHRDLAVRDSMCRLAKASGFRSVQFVSGFNSMFELIICSEECTTEKLFSACPPVELRTGLDHDIPCKCDDRMLIMNCGQPIVPTDRDAGKLCKQIDSWSHCL